MEDFGRRFQVDLPGQQHLNNKQGSVIGKIRFSQSIIKFIMKHGSVIIRKSNTNFFIIEHNKIRFLFDQVFEDSYCITRLMQNEFLSFTSYYPLPTGSTETDYIKIALDSFSQALCNKTRFIERI